MTKEDAFNAYQFAEVAYDAFFGTVVQEIGMEKALALHSAAIEPMGATQGAMIKQQAGVDQVDAASAHTLLESILETIGMSSEVVESTPERVVLKPGRCPIYEAGLAVGLDGATIEAMCRDGPIKFMAAAAKQLNPNLEYRLQTFRSGSQDSCVEEMFIA
jgi:hypothetical protein